MAECVQGSGSIMRPLVMDFASDKKASRLNDEYMFGRSFLVKPVTDPLYKWNDENKVGHEIYPDIKKASAPASTCLKFRIVVVGGGSKSVTYTGDKIQVSL